MKLGVLIAFLGVLIAFPHRIPVFFHVAGFALALIAGGLAILGFWPKKVQLMDSIELHNSYGTSAIAILRSQTLGTLQSSVKELTATNSEKSKHMTWAGLVTALATMSYGIGAFFSVKGA